MREVAAEKYTLCNLASLTTTVCFTRIEFFLLSELPLTVADPTVTFLVDARTLLAAVEKVTLIQ